MNKSPGYVSSPNRKRWRQLGEMIRQRRIDLGMSYQADVMARGGPGQTRMSNLEAGLYDSYRASLIHSLEAVFEWQQGSVQNFLDTGEIPKLLSEVVEDPSIQQQLNVLAQRLSRIEEQLRDAGL